MFETVYEIATAPPPSLLPLLGAAVGGIAATVAAFRRYSSRIVRFGIPTAAVLVLGAGGLGTYAGASIADEMIQAVEEGRCRVVEGRVRVLREQQASGHMPGDLIEVDGRRIEVNFFGGTPGYRDTIAHGGVLTEGAEVRLCLFRGRIARLELRRTVDADAGRGAIPAADESFERP